MSANRHAAMNFAASQEPQPPRFPGRSTVIFRGHQDAVGSVAFSPDGTTLATGSYDNTVRLWKIP